MQYRDLTQTIIGCAYRVHNKMGFGFLENVYQNCLLIELRKSGLHAEKETHIDVFYDEQLVGHFITDILVNNLVILELKSVRRIASAYEAQLVNYLVATGKPVGLLINFGVTKVEVKRKVKDLMNF